MTAFTLNTTSPRGWKRYPKYKDSGVEWLGEVPEEWIRLRLKLNSYIKGRIGWQGLRSDEFIDEGPYLITGMHFKDGSVDWDSCYHISKERYDIAPEIFVKEKDLIVTKDGSIGKIAYISYLPGPASLNSHLLIIRPVHSSYEPKYLYYLLGSEKFQEFILNEQTGTTFFGISQESVENFPMLLPPPSQQISIALFLDRETARIDALITKKEWQIKLLQEKRAALISHAVTKGLDPNAKMKDSGVEWLGMVPDGWVVTRVKTAVYLQRGYDLDSTKFIEGKYPVCGSNGIIGFHNAFKTNGPGITIGRSGSVGEVNYIDTDFWPHNTAIYVKKFINTHPRFIFFVLKIIDIKSVSSGSVVGTLNRNYIHNLIIALPPLLEQTTIAAFIIHETAKIDSLIQLINASMEKLREYRSSLISAAVTGKIDVRGEVEA